MVLSHRNIMGSVTQLGAVMRVKRHDGLMASTSRFHNNDCTLTVWYPVIEGVPIVIHSPEIELEKYEKLIRSYRIKRVVTTPAFLRGLLREPIPHEFEDVQILVTGRERLSRELADAFKERLGKQIYVSYGLMETTSAAALNLPDPEKAHPLDSDQPSSRAGSVGKLMPGQAAQIRHPVTGEIGSPFELGMLWLKGVNIFEGYFDRPEKTAKVVRDGWFQTGELARFDEDGFLFLEGRPHFSGIARGRNSQGDRFSGLSINRRKLRREESNRGFSDSQAFAAFGKCRLRHIT